MSNEKPRTIVEQIKMLCSLFCLFQLLICFCYDYQKMEEPFVHDLTHEVTPCSNNRKQRKLTRNITRVHKLLVNSLLPRQVIHSSVAFFLFRQNVYFLFSEASLQKFSPFRVFRC